LSLKKVGNCFLLIKRIFLAELDSFLYFDKGIKVEFIFEKHVVEIVECFNHVSFDESVLFADCDELFYGAIKVHLYPKLKFEVAEELFDFYDVFRGFGFFLHGNEIVDSAIEK
jgi:hypothetical protein